MWNEDYKDMLSALLDESADFILVGAYALARFGAPLSQISAADFEKDDMVVQIGVAPRRIDLVTGVSGLTFDDARRGAIVRDIEGIRVHILSMPDLIRNKLASGRPKDIEDAKLLQKHLDESGSGR